MPGGRQLRALRDCGLRLESPLGNVAIDDIAAEGDPQTVGTVDAVLFAVKLGDARGAAGMLAPMLDADTPVVTFQNGIDALGIVAAEIGADRVLPGAANIAGAERPEPGVVKHLGRYARFVFGERDGRRSPRAQRLLDTFVAAGMETHLSDDIVAELWEKFVLLAAASGVIAAARSPLGMVRHDPELKSNLRNAMLETAAVAAAAGIALKPSLVDDHMALLEAFPADQKSSMLQDLEAGRKLELDWLSGTVCRLARRHDVPTPVHDTLLAVLRPFSRGASG